MKKNKSDFSRVDFTDLKSLLDHMTGVHPFPVPDKDKAMLEQKDGFAKRPELTKDNCYDFKHWYPCPYCGEKYYYKDGRKLSCLHRAIEEIERLKKKIKKLEGKRWEW